MSKAKGIVMTATSVQGILAGNKTATRRVIVPQPTWDDENGYIWAGEITGAITEEYLADALKQWSRYQPGDLLYVKETFVSYKDVYYYNADNRHLELEKLGIKFKWRSPRFMPKAAARIFLRVTGVRAEQVQSISPEDSVAEGAVRKPHYMRYGGEDCLVLHGRYKKDFQTLWDSLNKKRGFGWDTNPWVWVYEFERCAKPEGWPVAA